MSYKPHNTHQTCHTNLTTTCHTTHTTSKKIKQKCCKKIKTWTLESLYNEYERSYHTVFRTKCFDILNKADSPMTCDELIDSISTDPAYVEVAKSITLSVQSHRDCPVSVTKESFRDRVLEPIKHIVSFILLKDDQLCVWNFALESIHKRVIKYNVKTEGSRKIRFFYTTDTQPPTHLESTSSVSSMTSDTTNESETTVDLDSDVQEITPSLTDITPKEIAAADTLSGGMMNLKRKVVDVTATDSKNHVVEASKKLKLTPQLESQPEPQQPPQPQPQPDSPSKVEQLEQELATMKQEYDKRLEQALATMKQQIAAMVNSKQREFDYYKHNTIPDRLHIAIHAHAKCYDAVKCQSNDCYQFRTVVHLPCQCMGTCEKHIRVERHNVLSSQVDNRVGNTALYQAMPLQTCYMCNEPVLELCVVNKTN